MNGTAVLLACAVVGALGVIGGGLVFMVRMLWQIRGKWDATLSQLGALVTKVSELVAAKEADHARLERRDDEIAGRLERHLEWHDRPLRPRRTGRAPSGDPGAT